MASTEVVLGVGLGTAGLLLIFLLIWLYSRNKRQEYMRIPEKGMAITYVNPSIEKQQRADTAIMNARFYLRSSRYVLEKYMPDIGNREEKQYYIVRGGDGPARISSPVLSSDRKGEMMMAMLHKHNTWPISLNSEQTRQTFTKIIKSLEEHPYISVPLVIDYIIEKDIAVSIRPLYPKGSLKDFIHRAKPTKKYSEKYENVYAMNTKLIARFGRQILEALEFLKYQGYPYYHLHSSNILVDDNVCYVSDVENSLVGAVPQLASFIKPLVEKVDPDVVCFGCVLFEMAMGYELESFEAFQLGMTSCNEHVKKVLESIFQPWYGAPPAIEDLLQVDLFADVKIKKPHYQRNQYSTKEKELLSSTKKCLLSFITANPINASEFQPKKKKKLVKSISSAAHLSPNSPLPPPSSVSSVSSPAPPPPAARPVSPPTPTPKSPASAPSAPAPPPPPPPKAAAKSGAPPPPPPPPSAPAKGAAPPRTALLSSIEGFNSKGLKKAKTIDKSGPKLR